MISRLFSSLGECEEETFRVLERLYQGWENDRRNRSNQFVNKKTVVKPLPPWMKDVFSYWKWTIFQSHLSFQGFSHPWKKRQKFWTPNILAVLAVLVSSEMIFLLGVHLFEVKPREICSTGATRGREVWDYDDRYKKAMELPPARRADWRWKRWVIDENVTQINGWTGPWLPKKGGFFKVTLIDWITWVIKWGGSNLMQIYGLFWGISPPKKERIDDPWKFPIKTPPGGCRMSWVSWCWCLIEFLVARTPPTLVRVRHISVAPDFFFFLWNLMTSAGASIKRFLVV